MADRILLQSFFLGAAAESIDVVTKTQDLGPAGCAYELEHGGRTYKVKVERSCIRNRIIHCSVCLEEVDGSNYSTACGDVRHAMCTPCALDANKNSSSIVLRSGKGQVKCPTCRKIGYPGLR